VVALPRASCRERGQDGRSGQYAEGFNTGRNFVKRICVAARQLTPLAWDADGRHA
jgi:hypothetical protein